MLPLIPDGTLLLVDPGAQFRKGDVVLATLGDGIQVAHRVVARNGDRVRLRGDFNRRGDPECFLGDIHGTVVSMIRKGQVVSCDTPWFRILTSLTLFTLRTIR